MAGNAIAKDACRWLETEVDNTLGGMTSKSTIDTACNFPELDVKAFGNDLCALGKETFGSTPITVEQWGMVFLLRHASSTQILGAKLDLDKHRDMVKEEEPRFKEYLLNKIQELSDRYNHVSARLLLAHLRLAVATEGDYGWTSYLYGLQARMNDSPKSCLHFTHIGWLLHFMISHKQLPVCLRGGGMNVEANIGQLRTIVLPSLTSQVVSLRAAVAVKIKTVEGLQTKAIAGAVSLAVPAANFAIQLVIGTLFSDQRDNGCQ